MFKIIKKDKHTKARLGLLKTPHGTIKTPSYVFVGTYGKFLHLDSSDLKKSKVQLIIANTFHLWQKALKSKDKEGFIHKSFGLKIPIMTDSGGFQVLSLAFGDKSKVGKFMTGEAKADKTYIRSKIKITEKGVHFNYMGQKKFLGPELSMKLQHKIGADIMFAFDQITSPLDSYDYNKKAVGMTDRWAIRCLKAHNQYVRHRPDFSSAKSGDSKSRIRDSKDWNRDKSDNEGQMLFGIVQGGLFKDLRIKSAKSIGSMTLDPAPLRGSATLSPSQHKSSKGVGFDGFGIGGSYTKKQIAKVLKWIVPHLPEEKPRHLLGVGKVEDIFEAVENGVDTFDCVIPTREARHGRLYTRTGHIDIRRGYFSKDKRIIEKGCGCPTCSKKISKAKVRELLKSPLREINAKGQRLCLMHNMWFFNKLLEDIRTSIAKGNFKGFKKKTLTEFTN